MNLVCDSLILLGMAIGLLPFFVVLWIFANTLFSDLRSLKLLFRIRHFPLRWMFVLTSATCMALAICEVVTLPVAVVAGFIACSLIYIFCVEVLATTSMSRKQSQVGRLVRRSRPKQLDMEHLATRKASARRRPKLRLRLRPRDPGGRNVRFPFLQ